ncbi:MAG TPA: hypothetical protein VLE69_00805 [Candidatus Saccharimonadales bacterium]|nr:hypothetical protein [Candidatus Saccharimonadales bacterium]
MATPGFIDEEGVVHHEFNGGDHGLKMDFGVVKKGMPEYDTWVELNRDAIRSRYPDSNELIVVGVANGTTDFAFDVADAVGHHAVGLKSEKLPDKQVRLTQAAKLYLENYMRKEPAVTVVLDDVGTTGRLAGLLALECLSVGAVSSDVQYTWQRSRVLWFLKNLEKDKKNNIRHVALINEVVPSLSPKDCLSKGDCSKGVELIPHGED